MKKRALLVAINYVGTSNELKGCINDSNNMKVMLTAKGFTDIKQILEKEATTNGIKAGMEWLIDGAQPGDVLVMHYSGHGSQLPSKAEADGFEEIICPVDLNWLDKVITDDTMRTIFNQVPNGVNTTLILDCCHSGTMLDQTESLDTGTKDLVAPIKGKARSKKRYMKPPAKIGNQLKNRDLVNWTASRDVNATALLVAGCKANQTSADAFINGQPQGAATAALLKSVSANSSISYRSLVTDMDNYMVANRYEQRPELDGSSSLYDQTFLEPFSFTVVPAPAPEVPIVVAPAPVAQESSNSKSKILIIVAAIAAVVALFLLTH